MEVILLETMRHLGAVGEKVKVKPGFARNYLVPYNKAIYANKENLANFEAQRDILLAKEAEKLAEAQRTAEKLLGVVLEIAVQASDEGKLYGSVGPVEILTALEEKTGLVFSKHQLHMPEGVIRHLGEYQHSLSLHTAVDCVITTNVVMVAIAE